MTNDNDKECFKEMWVRHTCFIHPNLALVVTAFPKLKKHLRLKLNRGDNELMDNVQAWREDQNPDFYRSGSSDLISVDKMYWLTRELCKK